MTDTTVIKQYGASKGWSFFRKLQIWVVGIIFGIMLLNAIIISVQANSYEPGVKYLGMKFLLVTENLGDLSRSILEQGGLTTNEGFKNDAWNVIKSLYLFFEAFIVMYLWVKVLSWIILHLILWDSSKKSVSFLLAIVLFFILQIIFILAFTDKSMTEPFINFKDFFKAIIQIVQPSAQKIVDTYSNATNR